MFFMKKRLNDLYLNPDKSGFSIISIIYQKQKSIWIVIVVLLLLYPVMQSITSHFELNNSLESIARKQSELEQQRKIYNTLIEKEKSLMRPEYNLTTINSLIQKIAQKHQIKINSLQWNLEQGKSIEMNISEQSQSLLNFIKDINQIPHLKFNMLTLTKSSKEKKVEMNSILVVLTDKE